MARKLKTYQTSVGFFDLAIAAPSMKAALEAWGSNSNLFHQGVAKQVDDPEVVAATMSKPGVVLRRPVGSSGPFKEHADLPRHLPRDEAKGRPGKDHRPSPGSTIRQRAEPHWPSKDSRGSVKAIAGRKRPPPRKSVSGASWQSQRRKQDSKRPIESMRRRQAQLKPKGPRSKSDCRLNRLVGRSRNRSSRSLYAERKGKRATKLPKIDRDKPSCGIIASKAGPRKALQSRSSLAE